MTQHVNAVNILVAAAEKYVAGLDDLAGQLVGEQVRLSKQVLEQLIATNTELEFRMRTAETLAQSLQNQLEEAQAEIPVFEEVHE